ncbi:MAG TPA: A24 family peptidase, partial [Coriobacteriia bacterium]|nr:A24 family peptidase [Coriobacteriia bacterium]
NPLVGLAAVIGVAGAALSQLLPGPQAVPLIDFSGWLAQPLVAALVGAVTSAGLALAIALAYAGVRKASGFGMGDVKLLAVLGIFLGPYGLLTLFLGSFAGAVVGIAIAVRAEGSMTTKYPFGPFLAASAVVVSLFGPSAFGWYLGLMNL